MLSEKKLKRWRIKMRDQAEEFSLKKRHRARKLCVQALYQWHVSPMDPAALMLQFEETQPMDRIDRVFFDKVFLGVIDAVATLDASLAKAMDRDLQSVDPVELTVLRMGAFELKYLLDVPYRVVIHEACDLQQLFGTEKGYQYVNGVLDRLAKAWRSHEYGGDSLS